MKKLIFIAALIAMFCCGRSFANPKRGKTNWKSLINGSVKVTAFSMDTQYEVSEKTAKKASIFHGSYLVSQKLISNPKDINQLKKLVLSLDGSYQPEMVSLCEPSYRHGILFQKGSEKVEAVICFECGIAEVFEPNGKSHSAYVDEKWLKPLNALYVRNKMRLPSYYSHH